MRCIVCSSSDKWKNVDEFRIKKEGMSMCESCGFVSYPSKYKSEAEIKEYYRKDYRKPPTIGNLYTGEKKLNLHNAFLKDLIIKWNEEGKSRSVFEIGAAYGLFLNWIRASLKECTIAGTEWTSSYKLNAHHEFGIDLVDDFDSSKKYDLIASYKVLEHQLDADKHLRTYAECLTEDGCLYLSVPVWFNRLCNFGMDGFDIEYYYHPNHINYWSMKLLKTLFNKAGLKIVKHDKYMYDDTFLLQRDDSLMGLKPEYEDPKEVLGWLKSIKEAWDAYQLNDHETAATKWPNFPNAYKGYYENNRAKMHKQFKFEQIESDFINKVLDNCDRCYEAYTLAGDISMRYDQWERAIHYIDEGLKIKPNDVGLLFAMSTCFRNMFNKTKDLNYIAKSRDVCRYVSNVSTQARGEAINWIYHDNSLLPMQNAPQARRD